MILSAIYIEEHFLFDKPQVINLGGRFIYSIVGNLISQKKNENFIPNFYGDDIIALVSTIVGRNGAGKSSLLNILTEIINNEYGYLSALIFEDENKILITNRSNVSFEFDYEIFSFKASTFYYSPYLDFKTDRNGFDLSLDNTVERDLEDNDQIRKGNERVNPIQHLKMRNWIRQIEFINSEMGQKFVEFFDLPSKNRNKITFTRYMIDVDRENDKIQFHNTPYGFREVIQFIYDKIRQEADLINSDRPKGFSLVQLQKELLKNYFLMDFICLFIIQMEKENRYLQEGFLKINVNEFIKKHDPSKALIAFFDFLDIHFYKFSKSEFTLLPIKETKDLINKVYDFIDEVEAKNDRDTRNFDWNNKAIYLEHDKVIELIKLQNDFLNVVENYYTKSSEEIKDLQDLRFSKIKDFINFQPSERSLSSGENAILNLFSRFHEVFQNISKGNMNPINFVLLDEADLGFHPQWKKRFVSTLIDFFYTYFKELKSRVQIIFTTHDSLTLSDILNYNVVYLDKTNGITDILEGESKPKLSFGANIHELLADSFFVEDGLIGEFAKGKISITLNWLKIKANELNESMEKRNFSYEIDSKIPVLKFESTDEEYGYHRRVIELIGEPLVKNKLMNLYAEFVNDETNLLKLELERAKAKVLEIEKKLNNA